MNIAMLLMGRCEAVALIGRQDVFHRKAAIAQRNHDLLGFAPVHARIVGALHHQQRRLDLLRRVQRRSLPSARFLPSGVLASPMRSANTLRTASQ